MKALPDLAKWRFKASLLPAAGTHPDFGVLTAFVERSLGRVRRNEILIHLANCAQCNQLVSLAAPTAAVDVPLLRTRSSWRRWSLVSLPRLAVPAFAAALVLVAVWALRPMRVAGPVVPVSSPSPIVAATPSVLPTPTSNAGEKTVASATRAPHAAVFAQAPRKPTHVPTSDENGESPLGANAANVSMRTAPPPAADVAKLMAAPVHTSVEVPPSSIVAAPAAGPCWRVSDVGKLQKSVTCGAWVDVSFDVPVFVRVMHSAANNIWLGGNGGALYHSEDDGAHWSRVNVPALTDDIVAIVFGAPAHGRLATADGATWATNDGGLTWKRQ